MSAAEDHRLEEARAIPVSEVAARLDVPGLRKSGAELVGPCPACGGTDRFAINDRRGVYNCRACGGGDGLALVRLVMGCDFRAALTWLCGDAAAEVDPELAARRRREREAQAAARAREADRYRRAAIERARGIWAAGRAAAGTPVQRYLELRGVGPAAIGGMPEALRYHPDLPYRHRPKGGDWITLHRGPAMLAGILAPDGALIGVHRTWLDLGAPTGKAALRHEDEALPAKKVEGSMKGGAIRLIGRTDGGRAETLVMGEGIETTLSAAVPRALPDAAFWSGVSLGNMSGRLRAGPGMRHAGLPEMDDGDAWLPPPWTRRLIFIADGDSEPRLTISKLQAGLRRARATVPGLAIEIAHPGEGRDLNDLLREAAT